MAEFFPPDSALDAGYGFLMAIDRPRYEQVNEMLETYGITDPLIVLEFCFMVVWIENYIGTFDEADHYPLEFRKMWIELDDLKEFLFSNRVTSIIFKGEQEKNIPGEDFLIEQDINIDRICDGIRSVFREEFQTDKEKRQTRGKKVWKKRKMVKVTNYIMAYLSQVKGTDILSLEEQARLINKLSHLAGVS